MPTYIMLRIIRLKIIHYFPHNSIGLFMKKWQKIEIIIILFWQFCFLRHHFVESEQF